jgi:hypothetical protein
LDILIFSMNMNTTNVLGFPDSWPLRMLQRPATAIGIAAICLVLDLVTGPFIDLSAVFIIPVAISAWFCWPSYAYALAILQPLVRFGVLDIWHDGLDVGNSAINAIVRIIVLVLMACLAGITARAFKRAKQVIPRWGDPPICCLCMKVRDKHNNWQPLEVYLSRHPESLYSHSLCPDCLKHDYGNGCSHD